MTTTQTSPPTSRISTPIHAASAGTPSLDTDHVHLGLHADHVGVEQTSPATRYRSSTSRVTSRGTQDHSGGHTPRGTQVILAAAVQDSPPAKSITTTTCPARAGSTTTDDGQMECDPHVPLAVVGVDGHPAPARPNPVPISGSLGLDDPLLRVAADNLDDIEGAWIATGNRIEQLTRDKPDKDGVMRGFGLPLFAPEVIALKAIHDGLAKLMNDARLHMERRFRKHPLYPWAKAHKGIGDKQAARLIAVVRDPYWNTLHNRPRTVSELRSYCGLRGDTPTTPRRKQKSDWSATAKMRTYLIAEKCIMQLRRPCEKPTDDRPWAVHVDGCACSPYRVIYDEGRVKYADAVHKEECKRCGPKGKPAVVGSELSKGHKKMCATRLMMEAILKNLWLAAREIHKNSPADQNSGDAHSSPVGGGQAGSSTDQIAVDTQRGSVGAASTQDAS